MSSLRILTPTVLAVLATTIAAGCSGGGAGPLPEARKLAPPTSTAPAPGTERVTCVVQSDEGLVTLALGIPEEYEPGTNACAWRPPPPGGPDGGRGPVAETRLAIVPAAESPYTLRERYDLLRPLVDTGGDDNIFDLALRTDVPAFGETVGALLHYGCSCDGVTAVDRYAVFAGVQLSWTSSYDDRRQTDAAFSAAIASGGVVRSEG